MHPSGPQGEESARVLTQAEADRCCAASEHDDSAPSPSHAFSVTLAVVLNPVPALRSEPELHVEFWRASVPPPSAPVPKHLLLSVFLV